MCLMDVMKIDWFSDVNNMKVIDKRKYISIKRRLLADILVFIINKIIIPFIRFNFYVTEKHKEGSSIFYFRKPLWKLVSKLTIIKVNKFKLFFLL